MKKLSIIVPVYKAEKYLDRCIESLVKQTYSNIEIILVDDGSPDLSGAICDKWAAKDDRIKVIHKQNAGAPAARNTGFENTTGDYIGIIDSDDYIDETMYSRLMEVADKGYDVVECGFTLVPEEENNCVYAKDNVSLEYISLTREEAMEQHIMDIRMKQVVWNKIYKKKLIVPFVEGKYIDDEFWTYQVIGKAERLACLDVPMYYYRQQPQSAMNRGYSLRRLDALEAKFLRMEYVKTQFPSLLSLAKKNFLFSSLYQVQMILKYLSDNKKEGILRVKSYLEKVLFEKQDFKKYTTKESLWIKMYKVIGLENVCRIRNFLKIGM